MHFNLSEWALRHRQVVLYLMIVLAIVGAVSYTRLGQSEDPPFTFKAMVIRTLWPGASAEEVARQVTDRIEKKLMETGEYERIASFSRPGESTVTFVARDSMFSAYLAGALVSDPQEVSVTFARTCRPAFRGHFSTMSSAPPLATSMH